jgi:hypothetical protein
MLANMSVVAVHLMFKTRFPPCEPQWQSHTFSTRRIPTVRAVSSDELWLLGGSNERLRRGSGSSDSAVRLLRNLYR